MRIAQIINQFNGGGRLANKMQLFYVLKIPTSYIIANNSNINISFDEARKKGFIVSLGDNQLLRFIRKINDRQNPKKEVEELYRKRNRIISYEDSEAGREEIGEIQRKIDELTFVSDIIIIKTDTTRADYKYLCKNGLKITTTVGEKKYVCEYTRLCAGAGQLRRNSAVFVDKTELDKLETIMMCGLTKNKIGKINLAKFNAYFSLYTSAMKQVTKPKICVIDDFEYTLKDQKIAWIFENEKGENDIEVRNMEFEQNGFDGSGIISPQMAKKWAVDMELDYTPASFIIRSAWIKGLVSIFDFKKFAKEVAHTDRIKDLWGEEYDVEDIDVILTKSQFKLWKKYANWREYLYYHAKFDHIFGVARVSKKSNDFYTPLNYQYIQSNNFTEESIKCLADFTIEWIKEVLKGDKLSTMLFLLGEHDDGDEIDKIENECNNYIAKCLIYTDEILNDSYVRNKIGNMMEKKIRQTKIGKLYVEGSYDFAIPDLYALCEHAFGMEVKGLLPAKYSWNKRWVEKGSSVVSMQRSPLVAPSENQLRYISFDERCKEWYKYIYSGMIMSLWDTGMARCSDADYDGKMYCCL